MAPAALACVNCKALTHAARLAEVAQQAREREAANNIPGAIELWNDALRLLPPDTNQALSIRDRVAELGARLAIEGPGVKAAASPNWLKRFGPVGAALAYGLSKAKFLIFGLAKIKTLFSMLAFLGVYWALYGWKFALGFVLGIYVHEMGHVWALRHFGLRASSPMFIPGFGAFVSLYDSPANVGQDARIGLAGPIWGTAASAAFLLPALLTQGTDRAGLWLAIAHTTAFLNLFNLIPVWQLDGGRGFRALDHSQRLMMLALMVGLWAVTQQGIFLLLVAGAIYRNFWSKDLPPEGDRGALTQFAGLLAALAIILRLAQ